MPKTTPYWGVVCELGIRPIKLTLLYKKLMLYHNFINSDDERKVRTLVEAQKESGIEQCWYAEVRKETEEIGIDLDKEEVKGKMKSKWKKEVKKKIKEAEEKLFTEKRMEMKKLRFFATKGCDTYLKEIYNEDARQAMKIRMNMVEWIEGNVGKEAPCPLCYRGMDTTEHVFACKEMGEWGVTVKDLENGTQMMNIVEMFRENEDRRRIMVMNEIETKMMGGMNM